jgi:hypothetical protein
MVELPSTHPIVSYCQVSYKTYNLYRTIASFVLNFHTILDTTYLGTLGRY